jgi:FAD/FMN-containing dehydrogenase/Fe-S oxidoreductase
VDPSTANRATLGGMAGNNSAGARSLRYGMMVDNVAAVEAVLPDGRRLWLGEGGEEATLFATELASLRALYAREADEIAARAPRTMRNVAGYDLARLAPDRENLARLLVGSEGTLAFFTRLRLRLAPLPMRRVVGVCHFPALLDALDAVRHIVRLDPSAVELVDRNVLDLAAARPDFRDALGRFVRGTPGALLLVEFASDVEGTDLAPRLDALAELCADLGFPEAVVRAEEPALQADVWSVRRAGLNIVMSMAGPRKPVSFIEDCAVPLEHLADYARRVEEIFARHASSGTWYAHASVGCLHVRPALNLKDPEDARRMRAIAEAVHEVVRDYGGTHSGEHGDGLLRSEFLEPMLGRRLVRAFAEVKRTFDPTGMLNPGKIVDPPRMDDRTLFRYPPGYAATPLPVSLGWPDDGILAAVERCNDNGACRKSDPGVMCPSFRATADERHSTRGRANALRLALTGQLGPNALDAPAMAEAMSLCISCKGCKRECPTGVDMARLKLEWLHRRNRTRGIDRRERLLAGLPRSAPLASRLAPVLNAAARVPPLRALGQAVLGVSARRPLPRWSRRPWREAEADAGPDADVVLLVDTFTRWFEPDLARAAVRLLEAVGHRVTTARPLSGRRPLCCGRTYLSAGMLDHARGEAERLVGALAQAAGRRAWIVGLEPSCLLTLRDEVPELTGREGAAVAERALLLEELLDRDWEEGRRLALAEPAAAREPALLVHGHCHQKAAGATGATVRMLRRIPGATVTEIASGCCGMAGAFGYHAEHVDVSLAMGELDLLPAVRAAPPATGIVANGTSCRAQIRDGAGREARHAVLVLADALPRDR